ncbi:hypothetical protein BV210_17865 (plasmid) [Halorientalis sp. IM1011]|uniref:nucleotide sugar dehydrogenase n=1 Tax=Halorientalis sp. IM1011 TaxID=1932360 RepID=UPI00097CCAD9|nr:hypothetical protein [Halorientalis sp. IM1011]AQL44635.1 hypothetical protein BV210_17865 [Halorientalis sp. IM1011]
MSELDARGSAEAVYGTDDDAATLRSRLQDGHVPVTVYGLDRTAIPLAATAAATAGTVVAADTDPTLVDAVDAGEFPYADSPALEALLADTTAADQLRVTSSLREAADDARVHVVSASTPITDGADLEPLRDHLSAVADGLSAGDTVVVESTLPVGTCRDELEPHLVAASDLDRSEFGFGFAPERPPASGLSGLEEDHTRLVAGRDADSERVVAAVFESLTGADTTRVSDLATAELAGQVTAAYRTVTTALTNEFARHAADLDVDATEVVAAASERADCQLPPPNLGAATCHPPGSLTLLRDELESDTRLLDAARVSNGLMPTYATIAVLDAFRGIDLDPADARVLVVGLDRQSGFDDERGTPAPAIGRSLAEDGVTVDVTGRFTRAADVDERDGVSVVTVETAVDQEYDGIAFASPSIEPPAGDTLGALATDEHPLVVLDGHQLLPELRNDDGVIYRGIGINA